jgi:hypothetical protein
MVGHADVGFGSSLEAPVMNVTGDAHDLDRPEALGRVLDEERTAQRVKG